jgi:pimeloyl-ACP methyl ester carboxylesterase
MLDAEPSDTANQSTDVSVPTLFIWGNQDGAVGRRSTELMADYMRGPYSILELDAGHWLLSDLPQQVIAPVLAHIQGNDSDATQSFSDE